AAYARNPKLTSNHSDPPVLCILGPLPVPGRRLPCPAIFSSYFGNKLRRAECSRRGEAYVWIPQRWRIPALNLRDCASLTDICLSRRPVVAKLLLCTLGESS